MTAAAKASYVQQVHRDCGGEIVVVATPEKVAIACRRCKSVWTMDAPLGLFPGRAEGEAAGRLGRRRRASGRMNPLYRIKQNKNR